MKTTLPLPQRLSELLCTIAIVTLTLLFASCQKEVSLDTPTPPGNILGDSIYLEGIYDLDSISPTQIDTFYYSKYEYDNLKRVIRFLDYDYSVSPHQLINQLNFFYQGQDSLPYASSAGSTPGPASTTTYYTYSSTGTKTSDSIKFVGSGYRVWKYVPITGGYKFLETDSSVSGGIYYDTTILMQTLQNGQIVRETETDFVNPDTHYIFEYDNKPNPVKRMNIYNAPIMYNALQVNYQGVSTNNISKRTFDTGPFQNSVTAQYQYHANGLPYRSYTYYQNAPPGGGQSILHYVYTDL